MYEALFYEKEGGKIRCLLCPRYCLLAEGQTGSCGVREVRKGKLYTTNYGLVAAASWDPIEKKPLYHFLPGSRILSIGTLGCNLFCSFCQNWSLARGRPAEDASAAERLSPEDVLRMLDGKGGPAETPGVAYTYNEPTIWYEFVYDTARLLHGKGYKNVLVTNGYINSEPLEELLPYIDALNIDVKAFTDSFYREYCRGTRDPVIETVERAVKSTHAEVTCLLIPTLNDGAEEQEELACWLGGLSPNLVLHYSRYFPQYKLDLPPTPEKTLIESREIARSYLRYVYLGNVDLPGSSDTICPHCGNLLVERHGYSVCLRGLVENRCNKCGNVISIVISDR
ncbi:MAG: AmmeMemoRadiSam system radical SAM enzyme [Bacillota bacterium]|nr:AmmeMemoRadiSam system radical SAM enzyme [Bacillota bacterium]